jgi:Zn-dependent M28 family amino/carboxypeptidase
MQLYGGANVYNFTVQGTECQNIIAKVNQGHTKIITFAAHFDSRNIAEKDPDSSKRNSPIMGANDGASGVAVMIEMARVLANTNIDWDYEFWFMFFDAEDQGSNGMANWDWCEGSYYLANELHINPTKYFSTNQNLSSIAAFILLDMVGGINLKFMMESQSSSSLRNAVFNAGKTLGYATQFPLTGKMYAIEDDHVPFAQKGVPTLDLIIKFFDKDNGWPYHHTSSDTIDFISATSLEITGRTLLHFVSTYYVPSNGTSSPPTFISPPSSNPSIFDDPLVVYTLIGVVAAIIFTFIILKTNKKRYLAKLNENNTEENTKEIGIELDPESEGETKKKNE